MARKGDWIQTYTGRQFWPLDPEEKDIDIEDIAHALSLLCRFGGHCKDFYSVAEHSIHVANSVSRENRLCGLLHDASEAYLVDMPRPIKRYLQEYRDIENSLEQCISRRYNLPWPWPEEIKDVDSRMLVTEQKVLMRRPPLDWNIAGEPLDIEIECWAPDRAKKRFLEAFYSIDDLLKELKDGR